MSIHNATSPIMAPAVLFIHGFTGHRASLQPLIPAIERRGIEWQYPVLAGHGSSPHDLRDVRWLDWHKDVELSLQLLLQAHQQVVIVALSMGTLLAMELAVEYPEQVTGLVLISPCVQFKNPLSKFTPWLAPLIPRMPFHPREKFSSQKFAQHDQGYRWFPPQPYVQYWRRSKTILDIAKQIHCPVKILHSHNDRVADPRGAEQIFSAVTGVKELQWFERSGHEMVIDCEAEKVIESVLDFSPLHV